VRPSPIAWRTQPANADLIVVKHTVFALPFAIMAAATAAAGRWAAVAGLAGARGVVAAHRGDDLQPPGHHHLTPSTRAPNGGRCPPAGSAAASPGP
jgi:hypothetical protein